MSLCPAEARQTVQGRPGDRHHTAAIGAMEWGGPVGSLGPQALLVVTCAMTLEALAAFPLYVPRILR